MRHLDMRSQRVDTMVTMASRVPSCDGRSNSHTMEQPRLSYLLRLFRRASITGKRLATPTDICYTNDDWAPLRSVPELASRFSQCIWQYVHAFSVNISSEMALDTGRCVTGDSQLDQWNLHQATSSRKKASFVQSVLWLQRLMLEISL